LKKKELRSGYTTGACAAAAAKAAAMLLISAAVKGKTLPIKDVEVPFPDGSSVKFKIKSSKIKNENNKLIATASVIKDAGDDPDVTNGAEIRAEVRFVEQQSSRWGPQKVADFLGQRAEEQQLHYKNNSLQTAGLPGFRASALIIKGGKGVGIVTKPGLPVVVGEAAINPVPRRMIKEAVMEALLESAEAHERRSAEVFNFRTMEIIISVPDGEKLAKKTLNHRLGIVGGISILGTTGIVMPVSSEAWTATITSSMDVAKAMGHDEIVLSAGRTSEKAHMKKYNLPEESYVMMGDYLEYSLVEAKKHGFKKIHLCAQWAKMLKIAMATPQTHVRHGAIDLKKAINFLKSLSSDFSLLTSDFNTAREIYDFLTHSLLSPHSSLFSEVCKAAKRYAEKISGSIPVAAHLISYEGEVFADSEELTFLCRM
jgi:cobalt-precorrin-5B (C1)-methyltransferase